MPKEKQEYKVVKVSYYNDYGGWGLNEDASNMLNELKGLKEGDDDFVDPKYGYINYDGAITRHDLDLIKVCEKYNGSKGMKKMAFAEVTEGMYRITEYDGWETVHQPNDEEIWTYCDPDRYPEFFI